MLLRDFSLREWILLLVPVVCLATGGSLLAYENRPYQHLISHYSTSLSERSSAQVRNIEVAARALNGSVVAPGESWSFNHVVGPRTLERGFAPANAFMEGDLTRSIGGGICQVSSTLYAAVQETTLPVVERVPHMAVVASVPPGRDATVWYGKADLRFENSFDRPVKIQATVEAGALKVELWGNAAAEQRAALRFIHRYGRKQQMRVVRVYRRIADRNVLLSDDVYRTR